MFNGEKLHKPGIFMSHGDLGNATGKWCDSEGHGYCRLVQCPSVLIFKDMTYFILINKESRHHALAVAQSDFTALSRRKCGRFNLTRVSPAIVCKQLSSPASPLSRPSIDQGSSYTGIDSRFPPRLSRVSTHRLAVSQIEW